MKIKTYFFSFLFLVFGFFAQAQISGVVVEMKNGSSKEGLMDIISMEMKSFKLKSKDKSGKTEKIAKEDVQSVTYYLPEGISSFVRIKPYNNARNKNVSKEEVFAQVIFTSEHISLYKGFQRADRNHNFISDVYYFCQRPGEEAASILIWGWGQINTNSVFKINGTKYFQDYPELSKKIEEKEYKYEDIVEVVLQYNEWKLNQK